MDVRVRANNYGVKGFGERDYSMVFKGKLDEQSKVINGEVLVNDEKCRFELKYMPTIDLKNDIDMKVWNKKGDLPFDHLVASNLDLTGFRAYHGKNPQKADLNFSKVSITKEGNIFFESIDSDYSAVAGKVNFHNGHMELIQMYEKSNIYYKGIFDPTFTNIQGNFIEIVKNRQGNFELKIESNSNGSGLNLINDF